MSTWDKIIEDAINAAAGGKQGGGENIHGYASQEAYERAMTRRGESEARAAAKASKAAVSAYKNLLAQWGVKPGTKKQAQAIARLVLSQANKAGANEAPRYDEFKQMFIKKFWGSWIRSTEGSSRVAQARDVLQSVYGDDWKKQIKGNKELTKMLKAYAGSVQAPSPERFEEIIRSSKTFKQAIAEGGELEHLGSFATATPGVSDKSLTEQVGAYNAYKKAFADSMRNYGASAEQIMAEDALFFSSGVDPTTFDKRYAEYNTNRQAYYELIGEGLTEQDRQAVLYGTNIAAQGMRDKIARATDVNALFQSKRSAFQAVAGRELSTGEKAELLAGQGERTKQALGRAGDVSQTLGQTAESYRLQTGAQLTQEQKNRLLYDEQAGDVYGALRSAFSLQKSYRSGGAGTFGFARSSSGALTQNI